MRDLRTGRTQRVGEDEPDRLGCCRTCGAAASPSRRSNTPITASTSITRQRLVPPPRSGREGGHAGRRLALGVDARNSRCAAAAAGRPRARIDPVDFVLIEGFHTHGHPVIEVYRPSEGHALLWREVRHRRCGERRSVAGAGDPGPRLQRHAGDSRLRAGEGGNL